MRKEADFEVTDKIRITLAGSDKVISVAERFADGIKADTLAVSLDINTPAGYVKSWNINGEDVELGVERD